MDEISYVVVFPTAFSKNQIPNLISNIKKILKIRNQEFTSVKREGDVILVNASDPVFTSSAINLIFGIEKIAIARQVKNEFKTIVEEITSVGGNLLLKGEKFLVKVEGTSRGFFTKDIEIAATSSIIGKKIKLGARPGTENDYNKLLYTYLTKNKAYICIFIDKGLGGISFNSKKQNTICAIYDELSAISCFETIKNGYDTKIIICYRKKSELINLAKIINQIIPKTLSEEVSLEFFHINVNPKGEKNFIIFINCIVNILIHEAKIGKFEYVSIPLSPLVFSQKIIEFFMRKIFQNKKIPILPLFGIDNKLFDDAKEIGIEKNMKNIYKIISLKLDKISTPSDKNTRQILKSKKTIEITIGPNNVHDILNSLEENH